MRWITAVVVIVVMAATNVSQATVVPSFTENSGTTLQELIDGQCTLEIGDKVFGDFGFSSAYFDASQVTVEAVVLPGDNHYGIQFTSGFTAYNGQNVDAAIFYSVTVTDPSQSIIGIEQSATLGSQFNGGVIHVDEFAYGSEGMQDPVAWSSIGRVYTLLDPSDPPEEVTDLLAINPGLQKIWIAKDINLIAAEDGSVSASIITQGFQQTPIPLPAAAGMGMLGLAMLGAGKLARKMF